MMPEIRWAGPEGARIPSLPAGAGAAIGSEYCVHLLPGEEALARAAEASFSRGTPLLLLTPWLRDEELRGLVRLLRSVPAGASPTVAVNDWGALYTLRTLLPGLRLTLGRLLSGQKRCPRVGESAVLTGAGRAWQGEGIFSSPSALRFLSAEMGVRGYHLDALPWSPSAPAEWPEGVEPPTLYLHGPGAVVTVSDGCPWVGGVSSAEMGSCGRPCRDGSVKLLPPPPGTPLVQRGKARFARYPEAGDPSGVPVVRVRYDELP